MNSPVWLLWMALHRGLHCKCMDSCHWNSPFGCNLHRGQPQSMLDWHIQRFLGKNNIVSHHVTWIAQNTRYNQVVIDDWVSLVNSSIIVLKYSPSCIVNIDETNIYFDMTQVMTLEVQGQHTVSIQNTGSTQCCTVFLGVTMDDRKLPPLIIFKGLPHGRIMREFVGTAAEANRYPVGGLSCVFTID